jgi:DNA helicase-2/ATP-dependent DNA helicase PcrA
LTLDEEHPAIVDEILSCEVPHQLVVAAAGSGKTSILLNVLVGKIKRGDIDPEKDEVIVFTFTNDAADELAVRLTKMLENQKQLLNRIFIGTIHGWCNNYLRKEGTLANTKTIDELERYQLLLRIYPLMSIEDKYTEANRFRKIEAFVKDLELFYNENLDLNDAVIPEKARVCIAEYIHFIQEQRLLDFGSLIRQSILRLKAQSSTNKYHLFVDEYQDVNLAQVELIKSVLGLNSKSSLFAVGDPRQAIYQWRGSDIRRILSFSSDFKDTRIFARSQSNYRSRSGIVEFANFVASDMDFSSYASEPIKIDNMIPTREDDNISVIHETGRFSHEENIVRKIKELCKQGCQYSDMAILMRSVVNHADELMNLLDAEEIPNYSPNKNAGIDFIDEFMGSILRLMEMMANERPPANRQEEEEIERQVTSSLESIREYCRNTSAHAVHSAVAEWYSELNRPSSKGRRPTRYPNEAYNFRRQFFEFCRKVDFVIGEDEPELQEGFSAITQIMRAIEEIYRRRFRLGAAAIRARPIDVFLNNLQWQLSHEIERWAEIGMETSSTANRVTISTVHAAKGLEWPVVFIPFLWRDRFPVRRSGHGTSFPDDIAWRYGTTHEDEKRLWYVAVTRARDRVYFMSGSVDGSRKPSPFTYSRCIAESSDMVEIPFLTGKEPLSTAEPHGRSVYLNIGVSDFLLLIECPYHFYLRRVKGVNVPVGQEFGAGNVLHKVVERLVSEGQGAKLDEIIDEEVYLPLAEHFLERNMKKRIRERVQSLIDSGSLENIILSEIPFKILIHNIVALGIVDAVRKTQRGLEIIDWKSSIHDEFESRYQNQVRFYAAGLRSMGYPVDKGLIYNLAQMRNSSGNYVVKVDVSPKRIKQLLKEGETNLKSLESGSPRLNRVPSSCNACDVRPICPNPYLEGKTNAVDLVPDSESVVD